VGEKIGLSQELFSVSLTLSLFLFEQARAPSSSSSQVFRERFWYTERRGLCDIKTLWDESSSERFNHLERSWGISEDDFRGRKEE